MTLSASKVNDLVESFKPNELPDPCILSTIINKSSYFVNVFLSVFVAAFSFLSFDADLEDPDDDFDDDLEWCEGLEPCDDLEWSDELDRMADLGTEDDLEVTDTEVDEDDMYPNDDKEEAEKCPVIDFGEIPTARRLRLVPEEVE